MMRGQPARLWDASDGHLLKEFDSGARLVSDTSSILAGTELWDTKTLVSIAKFDAKRWLGVNDAKTKGSGIGGDGALRIWDLHDGRLNSTLRGQGNAVSQFWTDASASLAVTLAKATFDKEATLTIWDAKTAKQLDVVDKFSTKAFFYNPQVSFAEGFDQFALWTDDYKILGWNGQKLIENPGVSNTQIGSTAWFPPDNGRKPQFSSDGTRVSAHRANTIVVLDTSNFLPVSILRTPSAESFSTASFENGDSTQVRAGNEVWKLVEAGRLHKQQLREWMCSDARLKGSKLHMTLTDADRELWYLGGRPPRSAVGQISEPQKAGSN